MLKEQTIPPSDRGVHAVLLKFDLAHDCSVHESIDRPGFSGATIRRVTTKIGDVCVRGWPRSTSGERVGALHRLLEAIRDTGLTQVPVPLKTSDGQSLVEHSGQWWQVERWLPGTPGFHSEPNDRKLESALTTLARWHIAASALRPTTADREWFRFESDSVSPAIISRARLVDEWISGGLDRVDAAISDDSPDDFTDVARRVVSNARCVGPALRTSLKLARSRKIALQPVLRDIWHDHVLFEGDAVTGIIDPSAASTDTVATDLSRLIGSLVGDDAGARQTALAAYGSVRPLSADELVLFEILDRSGVLLSALTWLRRRYLKPEPLDATRVLARLRTLAERLEAMTSTANDFHRD